MSPVSLENCIASTSIYIDTRSAVSRFGDEMALQQCCAAATPSGRAAVHPNHNVEEISSYEEPTADALAPTTDEGREWLR